jgi:hypothetical protein
LTADSGENEEIGTVVLVVVESSESDAEQKVEPGGVIRRMPPDLEIDAAMS